MKYNLSVCLTGGNKTYALLCSTINGNTATYSFQVSGTDEILNVDVEIEEIKETSNDN